MYLLELTRHGFGDDVQILVNMSHVVTVEPQESGKGCDVTMVMDKDEARYVICVRESYKMIKDHLRAVNLI